MRIRFAITLDISRGESRASVHKREEIPPHDVVEGGSYIERAPERGIGFAPPDEDEGRR